MINLKNDRFTLTGALQRYQIAWKKMLQEHQLEVLDQHVIATTVGWKVADKARLFADLEEIAPQSEQVHIGTVSDRFIASAILTEPIEGDLWIVKILERRPGSVDPLGLDSIDFLTKDVEKIRQTFKAVGLTVGNEHNENHSWVSVRFGANDEFEAKFADKIVLDVALKEMQQATDRILASL